MLIKDNMYLLIDKKASKYEYWIAEDLKSEVDNEHRKCKS